MDIGIMITATAETGDIAGMPTRSSSWASICSSFPSTR